MPSLVSPLPSQDLHEPRWSRDGVTDWTAEMPITSTVGWDGRLAAFRGRDAEHYVAMIAAVAKHCGACRLPLGPGSVLSLNVEITAGCDVTGTECLAFNAVICHLRCQEPGLRVREATDVPADMTSVGARMVFSKRGGSGRRSIAVLAYTQVPNLVFGEPGGEVTSVLVSALLGRGFQLSFSANWTEILQRAVPVAESCSCSVTNGEGVQLHVDGQLMHSQQLDMENRDDAAWLEAARTGAVLVISGDNLFFTGTGLELGAAARLGTLVTGLVPASF